jgi:protein-disulfide isomerase
MSADSLRENCSDLTMPVAERDHVQGSRSAPVVLVEYGDYECPDCLNAWPVVQGVRDALGDRVAIVFRHFPQSSIHPNASFAAQAAEAAAAQGKFWEMHDRLFRNRKELGSLDLTHVALQLGLEIYRFDTTLELTSTLRHIREDVDSAQASGVKGTPTFFINGCRYRGTVDVKSLVSEIKSYLNES